MNHKELSVSGIWAGDSLGLNWEIHLNFEMGRTIQLPQPAFQGVVKKYPKVGASSRLDAHKREP